MAAHTHRSGMRQWHMHAQDGMGLREESGGEKENGTKGRGGWQQVKGEGEDKEKAYSIPIPSNYDIEILSNYQEGSEIK